MRKFSRSSRFRKLLPKLTTFFQSLILQLLSEFKHNGSCVLSHKLTLLLAVTCVDDDPMVFVVLVIVDDAEGGGGGG